MSRPDTDQLIRALSVRYAEAADARDADAFAAVFCDDGVLVTPRGELRGTHDLRSVTDRLRKYDRTRHTVTGFELGFVDGDDAASSTWCTAEHTTIGDVCVETYVMTIRYDDALRYRDGTWQIVERRLVLLDEEHRQG